MGFLGVVYIIARSNPVFLARYDIGRALYLLNPFKNQDNSI
jgi:hypothetical protein